MAKTRLGTMVNIRALRQAHGLTTDELAELIAELGVPVDSSTLRHAELGDDRPSPKLLNAWAAALNIRAADVLHHDDIRAYLDAQDQVDDQAA